MIRRIIFFFVFALFSGLSMAQFQDRTSVLFNRTDEKAGQLNIVQDQAIDSLVNRYILMNKKIYDEHGYMGMDGFRIQIYMSSNRNAKSESDKVNADFISKFPGIESYSLFSQPAWYKIRVGNFRSRAEAVKFFLTVSKVFRDAYIVPDFIEFPELVKK